MSVLENEQVKPNEPSPEVTQEKEVEDFSLDWE